MIQFSGTTWLRSRYVNGDAIAKVWANHGGLIYMEKPQQKGFPYMIVTDSIKNPKAAEIDQDLKELAEKAASNEGVPLSLIYLHSERSNLTKGWQEDRRRRMSTLDLDA